MNDLFTPPQGRDLPPDRAREMRTNVMAGITRPTRPLQGRGRLRLGLGLALAGAVAVVAIGAPVWSGWDGRGDGRQLLALGPGEMSATLQAAANRCLETNNAHDRVRVTGADLAVAAEHGEHLALLFLTGEHYLACDEWDPPHQERSRGTATDTGRADWHHNWLPGPVDRLLMTSTEHDGGDVVAIGRVSARVDRLVLDHGDGRKTAARIANGAFGLISRGDVRERDTPELVSYDSAGNEIDRRPLFVPFDRLDRCYVDPRGTIVYGETTIHGGTTTHGEPGRVCLPAERWER
jgi:hypothetical protein